MQKKLAKEICEYQGIRFKLECKVYCHRCRKRTLILNLTDDKGYCIRCKNTIKSVKELHEVERSNFLDKHKAANMQIQRKG